MIPQMTIASWLASSSVHCGREEEFRNQKRALELECTDLRAKTPTSPAIPAIYSRLAELHSALGESEATCRSYARCSFQTVQLAQNPALAAHCLQQFDRCSDVSRQRHHRPDYLLAYGLLAKERGQLFTAYTAFKDVQDFPGVQPGRQRRAQALQLDVLTKLDLLDTMATVTDELGPTAWLHLVPMTGPPRPSATCGDVVPDSHIDLRFMVSAAEDLAFACIRRKVLGHPACSQNLVDLTKRILTVRKWDQTLSSTLADTSLNLAWAHFLANDVVAAAAALHGPQSDDPEARLWFHALRMKLINRGSLAGDWRAEGAAMDEAAASHGTTEARWLARLWRGEVERERGDLPAAIEAFFSAEAILDTAPLSLGFGAARQGYFTNYDLSLRNLVDLLHQRSDTSALLALARRAIRRPTHTLLQSGPVPIPDPAVPRPLQAGELILAAMPGTSKWVVAFANVERAESVELELAADQKLTNQDLLDPAKPWINANEVIYPLFPGRASDFPIALLPLNGRPLAIERRIIHVVDTPATADQNRYGDTAVVGVVIDDNGISRRYELEIERQLDRLVDGGWRTTSLVGPSEVTRDTFLDLALDARLLLLYARGERANRSWWGRPDNWDIIMRLGRDEDGVAYSAVGIEDILAAPRLPEVTLLLACESAGPGERTPGLLDGPAPLYAVRGSRWVVGVTGQIDECIARQLVSNLLPRLRSDPDLDVSIAVHNARTDVLLASESCSASAPEVDPVHELAKIVVFARDPLP